MKYWEIKLVVVLIVYFCITQLGEGGKPPKLYIEPSREKNCRYNETAYVQYATNREYLNLAMMNFINLRESNTQVANLVVLFNKELNIGKFKPIAEKYNITMNGVDLLQRTKLNQPEWDDSFTKLYIFNLTQYSEIVYFDSDSLLINATMNKHELVYHPTNLDELFGIQVDIAMPRAYWIQPSSQDLYQAKLDNRANFFASHVIYARPNPNIFNEIMRYVNNPWLWSWNHRNRLFRPDDYDMEIINRYLDDQWKLNGLKIGLLNHSVYGVLSGEFKQLDHSRYFSSSLSSTRWNSGEILQKIKLIHFSNAPIPKPWLLHPDEMGPWISCNPASGSLVLVDCDLLHHWTWIHRAFFSLQQKHWIK